MRNKIFCTAVAFFVFGLSNVSAQVTAPTLKDGTSGNTPELYTVGSVKGTVKTTAVYISKPVYPSEAQQVGAEGAIRVEVTISEEGSVISAKAFEGHPFLRIACEEAAQRTKFRIARGANGNAVKIEGILTYNFTIQKASWTRIGYGLSLLGRLPFSYFSIPTTAKTFAPEWTEERQMLKDLGEIGRIEPPMPPSAIFIAQSSATTKNSTRTPNGTTQNSAVIQRRLIVPTPPTVEQFALAQNLVSALQSRLGNDELSLWQFNLGLDLSRAFQTFRDPNERAEAARIVRRFAQNSPVGVAVEVKMTLENMAANFEKEKRTMESDDESARLLKLILKER